MKTEGSVVLQGTIVILDGVSTNRIMLKVQLSSAWYHVAQGEGLEGLQDLLRRTRPDLIVTAMDLPDGTAFDLRAVLASDPAWAAIPVIAINRHNDQGARLRALSAGIDDVLLHPVDDLLLQARIRSLIRARSLTDELRLNGAALPAPGLAETAAGFIGQVPQNAAAMPGRIAIVTHSATTQAVWRARLKGLTSHHLDGHQIADVQGLMAQPNPDAIVLEVTNSDNGAGLRLLADLRARSSTRHAAIIAVPNPGDLALAAEALDRGAHDVLQSGFSAEELALRIEIQLRRQARMDQLRSNVRDGLRAALRDPMTGLFNRRYAMPWLSRTARSSAKNGHSFAVMLADLDHFKQVNDQYGHPAGDAVLVETARRLQAASRPDSMIARIGGEEFMIVLPEAGQESAMIAADRLCREINATPFAIPGLGQPVKITISIGVAVSPPPVNPPPARRPAMMDHSEAEFGDHITDMLISQADRALYQAKGAGRNQFNVTRPAA